MMQWYWWVLIGLIVCASPWVVTFTLDLLCELEKGQTPRYTLIKTIFPDGHEKFQVRIGRWNWLVHIERHSATLETKEVTADFVSRAAAEAAIINHWREWKKNSVSPRTEEIPINIELMEGWNDGAA